MTAPAVSSLSPTGGPTAGGTTVTITGTTLTTPTAVTINAVNVTSFTGVNSTTITCVVPSAAVAGATAGTGVAIEVTTAGGTSSNGVTYDYWDQTFKTPSGQAPKGVPDTKRQVRGYYNLGPSYPTGGFTITPGLVGLTQVDEVASSVSLVGRPCAWVPSATAGAGGKLKVFAASDTEVAAGVDLHADSVFLIIWGK